MAQVTQDKTPLVWIDMEMSGLVPDRDRILEVAMVVTDADLNTIAEAPVYVLHQSDEVLEAMDSWNKSTHGKSGLVDKVRASTFTEAEVEARLVEFLKPIVAARTAPLCGNTVHQDRRFMVRYMPLFEQYLHYRIVDVSTIVGEFLAKARVTSMRAYKSNYGLACAAQYASRSELSPNT